MPYIKTGSKLGEMTDELNGGYINELVAAGPKQYAFNCIQPDGSEEKTVKVRGFSLTHDAMKKVNFDSMKQQVIELTCEVNNRTVTELSFKQIVRDPNHRILTKTVTKNYRAIYTKRRIMPDFSTLPFGHK